jgi:arsenite-transporting ATPase
VIPPELKNQDIPGYLRNRIAMQDKYLKHIQETFPNEILASVPEIEREVTGLAMIEKMAQAMFGNGGKP